MYHFCYAPSCSHQFWSLILARCQDPNAQIELNNQEWLYTISTQELLSQYDVYNSGMDALRGKNYEDAIKKFRQFLKQNPNDIPARENLRLCIEKIDHKQEDVMISATPFEVEGGFLEKDSKRRDSMRKTEHSGSFSSSSEEDENKNSGSQRLIIAPLGKSQW